tara:strand:+ start:511 stop:666 length:156 start_codon:yes stop_codon:yes gene_type:complete
LIFIFEELAQEAGIIFECSWVPGKYFPFLWKQKKGESNDSPRLVEKKSIMD